MGNLVTSYTMWSLYNVWNLSICRWLSQYINILLLLLLNYQNLPNLRRVKKKSYIKEIVYYNQKKKKKSYICNSILFSHFFFLIIILFSHLCLYTLYNNYNIIKPKRRVTYEKLSFFLIISQPIRVESSKKNWWVPHLIFT